MPLTIYQFGCRLGLDAFVYGIRTATNTDACKNEGLRNGRRANRWCNHYRRDGKNNTQARQNPTDKTLLIQLPRFGMPSRIDKVDRVPRAVHIGINPRRHPNGLNESGL